MNEDFIGIKSSDYPSILNDTDVIIQRGEIVGVVGESKSINSELLRIIFGNVKGNIGPFDLIGMNKFISEYQRNISILNNDEFLYSELTCRQNITYFARVKGIYSKEEITRVLNYVGLENEVGPYKLLPLGKKRLLSIAKAILGYPDVLILDNPFEDLDPFTIQVIKRVVLNLNNHAKMTVIISSTKLEEIEKMVKRFYYMNQSRLVGVFNYEDLDSFKRDLIKIKLTDPVKAYEILTNVYNIACIYLQQTDELQFSYGLDEANIILEKLLYLGFDILEFYFDKNKFNDYSFGEEDV